jgi:hypothetical protein
METEATPLPATVTGILYGQESSHHSSAESAREEGTINGKIVVNPTKNAIVPIREGKVFKMNQELRCSTITFFRFKIPSGNTAWPFRVPDLSQAYSQIYITPMEKRKRRMRRITI